jgi:hypothetical protein
MTLSRQNRRQFLLGAGGFSLALPFMPSLLSRAEAQTPYVHRQRFVNVATGHGAIARESMFPAASTPFDIFADHQGRQSPLVRRVEGERASVTTVLSGAQSVFSERLVSKMNVLRGLDLPFYLAHHTGGHLGNMGYAVRRSEAAFAKGVVPRPTIDQIMAWSPNFYSDLSTNRLRSMGIGLGDPLSWGYANPSTKSGEIQGIPTSFSTKELFDKIFVPPSTGPVTRAPVVDRVLESYRRLRDGAFGDAQRLSASDRRRLDDHMQRLSELERRVNVVVSCGDVKAPTAYDRNSPGNDLVTTNVAAARDYHQAFNDVIVAAFACGTSRIATIHTTQTWTPTPREWHQEVAHMANANSEAQRLIVDANRNVFEFVVADLASKLDAVEEAEGRTYLDNSLVCWSQESGFSTHDPISLPIVTFGSASGYFKTGYSVDYRNLNGAKWGNTETGGILYNQWLANVLQAMGIQRSEYGMFGDKGYGSNYREANWNGDTAKIWPTRLNNIADDPLPFLKA